MARVLVTSTDPKAHDGYHRVVASAEHDEFGIHDLTTDPRTADLILFVESWEADWLLTEARKDPIVKQYREKCFVVCEIPDASHLLPGVYTNVHDGEFLASRLRTGFYLWMYENEFAYFDELCDENDYLFSFVGSFKTASVRARIRDLTHPRAYLRDTSAESPSIWWKSSLVEKRAFQRAYAEVCKQSKFILCPRGHSPSTVRLFEAMRMGRVPVILSDSWVAPSGPNWDRCSIRIAERDVFSVSSILESYEENAAAMGLAARNEWDAWFSPEVSFHRIVEWCLDIQRNRRIPEWLGYSLKHLSLIGHQHIRRSIKESLRLVPGLR